MFHPRWTRVTRDESLFNNIHGHRCLMISCSRRGLLSNHDQRSNGIVNLLGGSWWHRDGHLMKITPKHKPWGREENGSAVSDAPAVLGHDQTQRSRGRGRHRSHEHTRRLLGLTPGRFKAGQECRAAGESGWPQEAAEDSHTKVATNNHLNIDNQSPSEIYLSMYLLVNTSAIKPCNTSCAHTRVMSHKAPGHAYSRVQQKAQTCL